MSRRTSARIACHPLAVGVAAVVVTVLFAVPLVTMAPDGVASQEPGGPAFEARDLLDARLAPAVATEIVIVEARDGDVLDPDVLRELDRRVDRLRRDPVTAPLLLDATLPDGSAYAGVAALTDQLDQALTGSGGLRDASDADVEVAVDQAVRAAGGPTGLGLATTERAGGRWRSPAVTLVLRLDNELLGGGAGGVRVGADTTDREQRLREVRDVLRGGAPGSDVEREDAGPLVAHAVAADVNLTADEQGQAAGPFIGITVLLTLVLVGLVFRSVWAVGVVGTGVAGVMIWLQGGANLLGLAQDQILATIVPIAIVAFGIDFAFHAIGRLEEERLAVRSPRGALAAALGGVGGALLLVLASDAAAFLANSVSGIESIVQFGVAATLGLTAAFLLLGVAAPSVLAVLPRSASATSRAGRVARVAAALALAGGATASVLSTIYVAPLAGAVLFVALAGLGVGLPAAVLARRPARTAVSAPAARPPRAARQPARRPTRWLAHGVVATARRGRIVLPVAAVVTAVAVVSALQVETRFDVQDLFSGDTDFVQGLDALDRHVGDNGGEPIRIVVTTDLGDPAVLARLAAEVDALRDPNGELFATDATGTTLVEGGVVDLVRAATGSPGARAQVLDRTGSELRDDDGDGVPDTAAGVEAVLAVAATEGLDLGPGPSPWGPAEVVGSLDRGPTDDATVVTIQLPDSRELTTIERAMDRMEPRVEALQRDLQGLDADASVVLTGAPIVRQLTLEAISAALLRSLPIALVACLLVAGFAMRSPRFALVAVVPIVLVVPWLYGVMAGAGYAVNLVTGTIGAISIGIGIDFALHLIARYREELGRHPDRDAAMLATAEGTGTALIASAGSSVLGFAALAFAPMPLFATYGLLTATMIGMALVATLLVLPPLLYLVTPERRPVSDPPRTSVPVTAAG